MQEWMWEKENVVRLTIVTGNQTFPYNTTTTPTPSTPPPPFLDTLGYDAVQGILIAAASGLFSFVTTLGNIMVMVSFKMDKQLQTISNYYLFSLAVADFIIGVFSMPIYTVNMIAGSWLFSPFVCDTYLAVDYLASNASVMNLLIISFDRYFSVTRPLSYRARRTTRKAAMMITLAWMLSLIIWVPWIYAWPYIEGERIPENECYVQFIQNSKAMSLICAMAAFYVPATVMCGLYLRVWWETVKRQRDLVHLQAGKKASSKRSNSSGEYGGDIRLQERGGGSTSLRNFNLVQVNGRAGPPLLQAKMRDILVKCKRGEREEEEEEEEEERLNSHQGRNSGNCTRTPTYYSDDKEMTGSSSGEAVYTILIQLPSARQNVDPETASIKILSETSLNEFPKQDRRLRHSMGRLDSTDSSLYSLSSNRDRKLSLEDRISLDTRIVPKQYVRSIERQNPAPSQNSLPRKNKVKKASHEKKQERKAAKTLSAILFVFIVTWTPYNVLAVMYGILGPEKGDTLIPKSLWDFSYYLCYMNSTINPFCYALCNAAFRRTYMRILTCKWKGYKKPPVYYYG